MSDSLVFEGGLLAFDSGAAQPARQARISISDGRIEAVDLSDLRGRPATALMPPLVNAHDHVRAIRPNALGAFDLPLELWLTAMTRIPPVDPRLVATVALGRQALGGCGAIMVHYTRPRDPARVVEELETVAAAAAAIGVRVAVAVALRDRNPLGYAPDEAILAEMDGDDRALLRERLAPQPLSAVDQVALVDELADRVSSPLVTVQYGPYGPEWCSRALLEQVARRSADTGRRVHMHLMESRIQREYLDAEHKGAPIRFLDEVGLLTPRLSVAHAIWLRPDEIELLAERGVTVCTNASSNLNLRSGQAEVRRMHACGVPLAMGMDGFSVDDDDDAFRELRLNKMLHGGLALEEGISTAGLFDAACWGGRAAVCDGRERGLAVSGRGDLLELDYAALSQDLLCDVDPAALVMRRATKASIRRLVVAGRTVVERGALTGVDLQGAMDELDAQARAGAEAYLDWRAVSDRLGARLRAVYASGLHRCG